MDFSKQSDTIIQIIREPLVILNRNLEIIEANPSFYQTFSEKKEEVIGKRLLHLPQWQIPEIEKPLSEVLVLNKAFETVEIRHNFQKAGDKTLLLKVHNLIREDLQGEDILIEFEDITASKIIEARLRDREEWFRSLIINSSDIIAVLTVEGNISYESPSLEMILGYKAEERIGVNIFEKPIAHPEDLVKLKKLLAKSVSKSDEIVRGEVRFQAKNGEWRYLEAVFRNKLSDNKIQGIIVNYRDITDRKINEQKIKDAIKLRDDFINIASHELKTPITSIKAYTQILLKKLDKSKEKSLYSMSESINRQISRLTELIGSLLDATKIQSGKFSLSIETFQIDEFITKIISDFRNINPEIKFKIKGVIGRNFRGDRYRLEQVLVNLITNAIKYSDRDKRIEVILTVKNKKAIIAVRDYGIGIAKENLEKIFERFFSIDSPLRKTSAFSSLGLGLWISKQIVLRHGGKIWVESELGKGSTFFIQLPLKI